IVAETSKAGGRLKSTHYRFNLNSVPTDAVCSTESASVEVQEPPESASVRVQNSVPAGHKERPWSRPKGYQPLLNTSAANAPRIKSSASPRKPQTPLPENFVANDENRTLASKQGVNLDQALAGFTYHHKAKGSR